MKRICTFLLTLLLASSMLVSCFVGDDGGGGDDTGNGGSTAITAEAWDALFSTEMFNNVSVKATAIAGGDTVTSELRATVNAVYTKSAGTEVYYEHKDGKTYVYAMLGDSWTKSEIPAEGAISASMMMIFDGTGLVDKFSYSEAEGCYIAENIELEGTTLTVKITVKDGFLSKVYMVEEGVAEATVEFYDYGTTVIELPEISTNEGTGDDIELPIVPTN